MTKRLVPIEVRPNTALGSVEAVFEDEEVTFTAGFGSADLVLDFCLSLLEAASVVWQNDEYLKRFSFEKKRKGV